MINIEMLLTDPDWFPHRYDPTTETISFVKLTPTERRAATFLDNDSLINNPSHKVALKLIEGARSAISEGAVYFVFHSAFCCSTLLVRALDVPGVAAGVSEPQIFNDLALAAQNGSLRPGLLQLAVALLSRAPAGEAVIIKPSNEANILMAPLLNAPAARAVLLSSSLDEFLFSVAKKEMWGRVWARRLFEMMRARQPRSLGFSESELFRQTDIQIAAMVWLMHRAEFSDVTARWPDRVGSLNSSDFLREKSRSLRAVVELFSLPIDAQHIELITGSGAFERHAKQTGRKFDATTKESEQKSLQVAHGNEIAMVARWAAAVADHLGVPLTMERPLLQD